MVVASQDATEVEAPQDATGVVVVALPVVAPVVAVVVAVFVMVVVTVDQDDTVVVLEAPRPFPTAVESQLDATVVETTVVKTTLVVLPAPRPIQIVVVVVIIITISIPVRRRRRRPVVTLHILIPILIQEPRRIKQQLHLLH